jgi:UPF0042 nucleotide-binding protein
MMDQGPDSTKPPILLVTGLSGAGMSTALRALQDLGWEAVDNLPIRLLGPLLATPPSNSEDSRPIAIGIDARTRGFDAEQIVRTIKRLREQQGLDITTLFLDCGGAELERRFSETRRRHPLAEDRPAGDGVAREREMLEPLRRWAEQLVDTTSYSTNDLQAEIRRRFALEGRSGPTINVMSFGFSRGLPRNADLVFDVRFLRNPHWDDALRAGTGLDPAVADYIRDDPAYDGAIGQIEALLTTLIPRYHAEGRSYLTIAIGCTGGRHRSVHVAERLGAHLSALGYAPNIIHRNLSSLPQESLEGKRPSA